MYYTSTEKKQSNLNKTELKEGTDRTVTVFISLKTQGQRHIYYGSPLDEMSFFCCQVEFLNELENGA